MTSNAVFLDANVLVYALDRTSELHTRVASLIQSFLDEKTTMCTSHHIIEEVLHITKKIKSEITPSEVINEIDLIPDLLLVEPDANISFAKRYAALSEKLHTGVNDAPILQLMLDVGITMLFSYDKRLLRQAAALGMKAVE